MSGDGRKRGHPWPRALAGDISVATCSRFGGVGSDLGAVCCRVVAVWGWSAWAPGGQGLIGGTAESGHPGLGPRSGGIHAALTPPDKALAPGHPPKPSRRRNGKRKAESGKRKRERKAKAQSAKHLHPAVGCSALALALAWLWLLLLLLLFLSPTRRLCSLLW